MRNMRVLLLAGLFGFGIFVLGCSSVNKVDSSMAKPVQAVMPPPPILEESHKKGSTLPPPPILAEAKIPTLPPPGI